MLITSKTNPKIVMLKKILSDKKYRTEFGLYCIEGAKLVAAAIDKGLKIKNIFIEQTKAQKFDFLGDFDVILVDDKIFDSSLSSTETSQGIVALIELPKTDLKPPLGNCLVLENLQDSGNVGTLLRTAAATGFCDIYLANCADVYSPKVLRSAMSAHFHLNLHQTKSIEEVFEVLPKTNIICADMAGESVFEGGKPTLFPIALVLGNEGNGVSEFVKKNSHQMVSLPMKNNFESLNVAIAGSVLMYLLNH